MLLLCQPQHPGLLSLLSIPISMQHLRFSSEATALRTANLNLLIMTSFSELPCLDSLQGVCIFPGVLQTRGGNLQLSTKREMARNHFTAASFRALLS